MPRFDQSFNGLREQNLQETQQLKQRFLDGKNKRVPKAKDKKQQDSIQSSVHVQQKFLKRGFDEHDPTNEGSFEPPVKLQCTTQGHQPDGCTTKFSVEIVQQLEFTTSAASSQPQQISTNVTVKAHTNASMKTGVPSPATNPDTPKSTSESTTSQNAFSNIKQEPEVDFADLDQCAAALEKDANGGNGFPLADLLNENTPEAAAYLQDFLFELDDIKGYIFDEKKDVEGLKVEDLKDIPSVDSKTVNSPLNQNYSPPVYEKNRMPYSNLDFGKAEMSPAAQTLKQMAEQHQNKNQMGLNFNPNNRTPTSRSPYPEFPMGDYGSPNNNFHKSNSFGAGTPPRPPSGPGGAPTAPTATLQINQAQQLHINQQGHGHNIQVSVGQHLHLSGDLKGNVSVAAQQAMQQNVTSPQQNNQNHQNSSNQHANPVMSNQQHSNLQGSLGGMNNTMNNSNIPSSMPSNIQSPGVGTSMHSPLSGLQGNMPNSMGMMGGSNQNVMGDSYSMSQSQTINFTQQTLRQRSSNAGNGILPTASQFPMNARHMNPQTFDPKLLQQQQMLRAQNQQHVRPPPPDYKSTAGMMQNMQPRYSNPTGSIRRMPHQPLPPTGPMVMRPNHGMFVSQQQHMQARGMYPRQQTPMGMSIDNMPQAGTIEWRQHMMMAQQQNTTYSGQMRPNYQQGFNSGNVGMPITHQMRMQQNMAGGTMTTVPTMQQGMSQNGMGGMNQQMNHMNGMSQQQILQMQQQQQQQMSMNTLHMQQTQSVTITNQAQQQQQMLLGSGNVNNQQSNMNNFSSAQANDFNLEFLDNPDAGEISAQELLSSFDQSGFLRDILN